MDDSRCIPCGRIFHISSPYKGRHLRYPFPLVYIRSIHVSHCHMPHNTMADPLHYQAHSAYNEHDRRRHMAHHRASECRVLHKHHNGMCHLHYPEPCDYWLHCLCCLLFLSQGHHGAWRAWMADDLRLSRACCSRLTFAAAAAPCMSVTLLALALQPLMT